MEYSTLEIVLVLVITLFSIVTMIQSFREFKLAIDSKHWKHIEGVITTSTRFAIRGEESRQYFPFIAYEYEVNGVRYFGERISFGTYGGKKFPRPDRNASSSFPRYVGNILRQYPEGKRVRVYISSHDPHLSVLEPGIHWELIVALVIPLAFLIFGITVLRSMF